MSKLCPWPPMARRLAGALGVLTAAFSPSSFAAGTAPLNDTGVSTCVDPATLTFVTTCKGSGQDAAFGRDVTDKKNAKDGVLGFSFAKVCNNGALAGVGTCPANPKLGPGKKQWGCTKDLVTGLIWEVKTADDGFRDWRKNYSNTGVWSASDAQAFADEVNAAGLCGAKDWRLPTRLELQSLVDYGRNLNDAPIDTNYFPNTKTYIYWTGERLDNGTAWVTEFTVGWVGTVNAQQTHAVRLVRAGL